MDKMDPGNEMPGIGWMLMLIGSAILILWMLGHT